MIGLNERRKSRVTDERNQQPVGLLIGRMSCEMKRAFLLLTLVLAAQPQSADLTLSTIPSRIFKENDGVVDAADSETFISWIVVKGIGSASEPLRAEYSSSPGPSSLERTTLQRRF